MDKSKEIKCLDILNDVVSKAVPKLYYSIGYSEGAVCIENENDQWSVYVGERNQKKDREDFNNVVEASLNVLSRFSDTYPSVKDDFLNTLIK